MKVEGQLDTLTSSLVVDVFALMTNSASDAQGNAQVAQVAFAYSHFETASNSVLLTCSRILKKNRESQDPFHDEALVAHLLSIEEPICCEVELQT